MSYALYHCILETIFSLFTTMTLHRITYVYSAIIASAVYWQWSDSTVKDPSTLLMLSKFGCSCFFFNGPQFHQFNRVQELIITRFWTILLPSRIEQVFLFRILAGSTRCRVLKCFSDFRHSKLTRVETCVGKPLLTTSEKIFHEETFLTPVSI